MTIVMLVISKNAIKIALFYDQYKLKQCKPTSIINKKYNILIYYVIFKHFSVILYNNKKFTYEKNFFSIH